MSTLHSDSDIRTKVDNYFTKFTNEKFRNGTTVYIDMEKVGNLHIFKERYAYYHSHSFYHGVHGKTMFNVHVSPFGDKMATLSILVRANEDNIEDILSSLSTSDPRIKKKEL
jgi:hypothetical protein